MVLTSSCEHFGEIIYAPLSTVVWSSPGGERRTVTRYSNAPVEAWFKEVKRHSDVIKKLRIGALVKKKQASPKRTTEETSLFCDVCLALCVHMFHIKPGIHHKKRRDTFLVMMKEILKKYGEENLMEKQKLHCTTHIQKQL